MSWPYVVAAVLAALVVGAMVGVVLMGALCNASRAVELDHIFLSRSVR